MRELDFIIRDHEFKLQKNDLISGNVLLFLIEDPPITLINFKNLDNSKRDLEVSITSSYKSRQKVATLIKTTTSSSENDEFVDLYLENDKLYTEDRTEVKYTTFIHKSDERIIYNGTYYKLFDTEKIK